MKQKLTDIAGVALPPVLLFLLILALWQIVTVWFEFPVYLLPSPWRVLTETVDDLPRIEEAARKGGAHEMLINLPHGYDTVLGNWFADGHELASGSGRGWP